MSWVPYTIQNRWIGMVQARRNLSRGQRGGNAKSYLPMLKRVGLNQVKDFAQMTLPGVRNFAVSRVGQLTDFGLGTLDKQLRQRGFGLKSFIKKQVGKHIRHKAFPMIKSKGRLATSMINNAFDRLDSKVAQLGGRRKKSSRSLYMPPGGMMKLLRTFAAEKKLNRAAALRRQRGGSGLARSVAGATMDSIGSYIPPGGMIQLGYDIAQRVRKQRGGNGYAAQILGDAAMLRLNSQIGGRRKRRKRRQRGGVLPLAVAASIPALKAAGIAGAKFALATAAGPLIKTGVETLIGRRQRGGLYIPRRRQRRGGYINYRRPPPFIGSWKNQLGLGGVKTGPSAKKPYQTPATPYRPANTVALVPVSVPATSGSIATAPARKGGFMNFLKRAGSNIGEVVVNKFADKGLEMLDRTLANY